MPHMLPPSALANAGIRMEAASIDEIAAAGEQEFIRARDADDTQGQQPEDGEIAVGRDPLEDGAFQLTIIAEF